MEPTPNIADKVRNEQQDSEAIDGEILYDCLLDSTYESVLNSALEKEEFRELIFDKAIYAMHELTEKRMPDAYSLDFAFKLGFVAELQVLGLAAPELTQYGKQVYIELKMPCLKELKHD